MLASEAISLMSTAELRQVKVKDDVPSLLNFINRAQLELHKRFILWQEEATVTAALGKRDYKFDGIDPDVTIDLTDHDFLRIDAVYDENGDTLGLNDEVDPFTVATPRWNIMEIPEVTAEEVGAIFSVIYRATPKFIIADTEALAIPPQLYEALFLYCAFLAYVAVNGDERTENNTYYKRFERSLAVVDTNNLLPRESMDTNKWTDRGFV